MLSELLLELVAMLRVNFQTEMPLDDAIEIDLQIKSQLADIL